MKYFRYIVLIGLIITNLSSYCQPPCAAGTSNLMVLPNSAQYCLGDDINFNLMAVPPKNIAGAVKWTYSGTSNSTGISGGQDEIYDIFGVQTGGVVTATGTLIPGNCIFTETYGVTISPQLYADAGPDGFYGGSPVAIGGTGGCASGGAAPYTYQWSPGGSTSCNISVSPSASTIYYLSVIDANGCVAYDDCLVTNISSSISYIVPKKNIDAGYQIPKNNKIYFKFEEEYKSGTLNYKILDFSPTSPNIQPVNVTCGLTGGTAKSLGDNRYSIDLTTCSLTLQKYYLVEITSEKNEKFYFKFLKTI